MQKSLCASNFFSEQKRLSIGKMLDMCGLENNAIILLMSVFTKDKHLLPYDGGLQQCNVAEVKRILNTKI